MSKIVEFPIERTNVKPGPNHSGSAEIVIFPGVRIERREFCLADRHQTAATTAKLKPAIS
jgi:hypothetical protein